MFGIQQFTEVIMMKRLKKMFLVLCPVLISLVFICSCGRSPKTECPFTEITWDNTLEDVLALEGEPLESYASIYSGTTYSFSKDFHAMSGTIKYMFDDRNQLMSMAWLYLPESKEELENVYQSLCDETNQLYGESGFDSDTGTAKGNVWYLQDGNILIGVMSTGTNEADQYQFFHPDAASQKPQ